MPLSNGPKIHAIPSCIMPKTAATSNRPGRLPSKAFSVFFRQQAWQADRIFLPEADRIIDSFKSARDALQSIEGVLRGRSV
jgi:hypothetical protein